MFKTLIFVKRHPDIDRGLFAKLWLEKRAVAIADGGCLGGFVRRYAYNSALLRNGELSPTTHAWDDYWDGIDEMWFDSEDDLRTAASDAFCNVMLNSGKTYRGLLDVESCRRVVAREAPNVGSAEVAVPIKSFILIGRLPQLTQQQFYHHWTVVHPPLWVKVRQMLKCPPPPKTVKNYLDESLNDGMAPLGFDGIAEGWHGSLEEMGRPFQTREHDEIILADADLFRAKTIDILATEHVLFSRSSM